jgi:sucrose-6-phosphate hydrolase SacC (GH32 family)
MVLLAAFLPAALVAADGTAGVAEPADITREARAREIEAKIGREGLTLADQIRGTRELRQRLQNDPHRPRYHLMPPEGFWNDINGAIHWKGRCHLFFLGRSAPDLETILSGKDTDRMRETWFHASSRDLVHWIHHPPALVPVFDGSMPKGLFSGDMMDNMPVPTIMVHVPGQGTCLYTAEDDELNDWKPHPKNPVIPIAGAPPEAVIFDPCGWKEGDVYYALIGSKNRTPGYEGDSTSLFRSRDLASWEYRGPFYQSDRRWTPESQDCACPDLRHHPRHRENLAVSGEFPLDDVRGDCLEISAVIEPGDAKEFGIKVRCSPRGEEQTVIVFSPEEKTLKIDLSKSSPGIDYTWGERVVKEQAAPFELKRGEPLRLRVFLDRSVLEVFANGRQCLTQRIYPSRGDSLGVTLVARGGSVKVTSLDVWDMSPIH